MPPPPLSPPTRHHTPQVLVDQESYDELHLPDRLRFTPLSVLAGHSSQALYSLIAIPGGEEQRRGDGHAAAAAAVPPAAPLLLDDLFEDEAAATAQTWLQDPPRPAASGGTSPRFFSSSQLCATICEISPME